MTPSRLPTNPIVKLVDQCLESICKQYKLAITIIIKRGLDSYAENIKEIEIENKNWLIPKFFHH